MAPVSAFINENDFGSIPGYASETLPREAEIDAGQPSQADLPHTTHGGL